MPPVSFSDRIGIERWGTASHSIGGCLREADVVGLRSNETPTMVLSAAGCRSLRAFRAGNGKRAHSDERWLYHPPVQKLSKETQSHAGPSPGRPRLQLAARVVTTRNPGTAEKRERGFRRASVGCRRPFPGSPSRLGSSASAPQNPKEDAKEQQYHLLMHPNNIGPGIKIFTFGVRSETWQMWMRLDGPLARSPCQPPLMERRPRAGGTGDVPAKTSTDAGWFEGFARVCGRLVWNAAKGDRGGPGDRPPEVEAEAFTKPKHTEGVWNNSTLHTTVYTSWMSMQVLQVTSQHHLKLQLQFRFTSTWLCVWPRLQHIRLQPSTPLEVRLHSRPCVPSEPVFAFGSQKSSESSVYTRSRRVGGLIVTSSGMKLWPSLRAITFVAPSKCSFSRAPTSENGGSFIQHVLVVHDPDSPWHLHSMRMNCLTA
uniref:Uncharacterized protein n=1 Tax=Anopheles atroparvus TaxID=41427 RepID=A0A182J8S3_ANOAO